MKYKQAIEYLIMYFGSKKNIRDITAEDANDFRMLLFKVPKFWKNKPDLKDKNIKLLIDKKSKILDKYEKQELSTVNEVVKKVNSIFSYFENNGYIYKNPFAKLTKIDSSSDIKKREFTP